MDEMKQLIEEADKCVKERAGVTSFKTKESTIKSEELSSHQSANSLTTTPQIDSLIEKLKQLHIKISENELHIARETSLLLCPVCQNGHLQPTKRKALKIFSDDWLVCDKCNAEFDKKFSKAMLVKATEDPYGIFNIYANKTFELNKWNQIALERSNGEKDKLYEHVSSVKNELAAYVIDQFMSRKLNLMIADVNGFILKKGEIPFFSTKAEIIEERKRRVTERTTTGGGRRNYGGFSFRVARGIYYHTGSSSSASPRQTTVRSNEYTELVTADDGDLMITNQRIMFKGNRSRGLAIPVNKIAAIDVDPDENALLIVQENKKPAIIKLQTALTMHIADIPIPLLIDLDALVGVVRRSIP